ncbi:fused MFS/spermidine synthase [Brevibacterium sp. UMB1308A]|uniref:spermidine synthase n=1 Tax=Brevibacterium sp. UMB1308A TaxID=3050608 RepID=UPI00254CE94A|nr:fused MFS/spermidine synthase [Brevibacterium sp. UMB1308A]MDK8346424.1 fused MFS/spermidine synthase [Brevibacterium sp. UMB1308B]MDK8713325.1 fused MFS/spermidine synthase [Brevibacterium sp. UMB1308A]
MGRKRAQDTSIEVEISTGTARKENIPGDPNSWVLYVNSVPSSSITVGEPTRLDFPYLHWMATTIDHVFPPGTSVRAVHIGAAGCSLARRLHATHPRSRQTAIDVDALLMEYVREWFDLPRSPALALRVGDGAREIQTFAPGSINIVVRDAFAEDTTPQALTTHDYFAHTASALKPGGLALFNIAGTPGHARQEINAISSQFAQVYVIHASGRTRGQRENVVIAALASASALDKTRLAATLRTGPAPATITKA